MKLVLDRFTHNALALLAVTTILFFMFRLMPGTPLAAFINENLNADQQQMMLEQFGLDKPMWQQYFIYLGNLLRGEFGLSFFQRRPVLDILLEVLPNSVILTLTSLIIAYIFGVLAGAWLAWKRGSWIERIAVPAVLATRAAPEFWIGMVLLALLYGISNGWDWESTGRLGSIMGSIKIAHRGPQNHSAGRVEIEERFRREFGYSPW